MHGGGRDDARINQRLRTLLPFNQHHLSGVEQAGLVVERARLGRGNLGWLLLSGYAGLRFLLEFIRADVRGGMVLGLSPSQVLSLAVLCVAALALWVKRHPEQAT